jgi:hypothetical protein
MRKRGLAFGCVVVAVAGCGGNGNQGFGVGGPTMCGQVSPCGGDPTGTWNLTTGCVTGVGIKDAESGTSGACPGESVGITAVSVSGTVTFNSDMTYTFTALTSQGTYSLSVPSSCLNGASCSTVAGSLEESGVFESASCSGSSGCSCTALQTPIVDSESGTYTISGDTLTTVPGTGSTTTLPFCVMGSTLHLLDTSTTSMGAMGQAVVDEDTIGLKQ